MRTAPRERHPVGPRPMRALRPLFRYSIGRDAYVLRLVGNRYGPVLRVGQRAAANLQATDTLASTKQPAAPSG